MSAELDKHDAKISERVLAVFAHYQRHLQRGGGGGRAPADTLIIAATLTAAHFGQATFEAAEATYWNTARPSS